MYERMETRNCDNPIYLRNLVKSLEEAKVKKDTERIILCATELERYKVLCGYTPAIQQLEESMKRVSEEIGLTNDPTIQRAFNTAPQKTCCKCCKSEQSPHQEPQRREGFANMVNCALGLSNAPTQDHTEPEEPTSEFQRMIQEARGKNNQTCTPTPNMVTMTGMLRMVDESQFPQFCDPEKCPKDFARHCSANRPENHGKSCIYVIPRNR